MNQKRVQVPSASDGTVSGILDVPKAPIALLILAHGAGAGMEHSGMADLAQALNQESIATLRFQFPFMEAGSKRPDFPAVAMSAVAKAVDFGALSLPGIPLFAGGRSFGGRMTTTAASKGKLNGVSGIICFGFPLHPPKAPGIERADHLKDVSLPMLWIQGTRDAMSDVDLVKDVAKKYRKTLSVHFVEGADHGYGVKKSLKRTPEEVLSEVAQAAREFIGKLGGSVDDSRRSIQSAGRR